MGLSDTGRSQQDDVLLALDEAELVEILDLFTLDGRLEREVELIERVVSKNTNALKAHAIMAGLDRAINAGSTFCGAQPADRRLIKFGARG